MTIDFAEDFDCTDDLRADLGTVSGILVLEQAIYRRLNTPRGTLPPTFEEEPDPVDQDYGSDLAGMLHLAMVPNGIYAIQSFAESEVRKEDAVDGSTVDVTMALDTSGASASATLTITGMSLAGPFSLVIGVANLASNAQTISLLKTSAQG